jgi:hypothetical protein
VTSCSTAGDSAALPSETAASVRACRRGRTVLRCTERDHVVDEPSPATRCADCHLRQRCATHVAHQPVSTDHRRSADKLIQWKTVAATVRGTHARALGEIPDGE